MTLHLRNETSVCKQIKKVAASLFLSQGFEKTSISDLVERLPIEEHTFYTYFQSMDELLESIWSES